MEDGKSYKKDRAEFAAKWDGRSLFDYVDQWPLYTGTKTLARFLTIADLFHEISEVPGDIVELGSWKGANVVFLAKLLDIYTPNQHKKIHCFEGFQGLTRFVEEDGDAEKYAGMYKGSYEELLDVINLYNLASRIEVHKGLVQDTVPLYISDFGWRRYSLIFFDCDLYEPAKIALEQFYSRLNPGGIFILDEWNFDQYPGETDAVSEFLESRDDYQLLANRYSSQPSLVIKKT